MDSLVLHPASRKLLENYIAQPAHAMMLSGGEGVGLGTIAEALARAITEPAFITTVMPTDGNIPIAVIRELYAHTKTKQDHRHVIILDDANTMRTEAQNALLKLLEEPTSNVQFILTTHVPQLLLPTIRSRVQPIDIRPVSQQESARLLQRLKVTDETKLRQILFIAAGHPAEVTRLAENDEYFLSNSQKAVDARAFLQAAAYERLIMAAKYGSRDEALAFLDMLGRFAIHTLYRQPDLGSSRKLEAIDTAIERINGNGHVRTQLSWLIMQWA